MSETAFRFLLQNDRQPFRPSRCYIVADPKMDDRTQWTLELDAPEDAPWIYELDDIKDWMLHGDDKPMRQMFYDANDPRTPYRNLERDEVFREYVRRTLGKIACGVSTSSKIRADAINCRRENADPLQRCS